MEALLSTLQDGALSILALTLTLLAPILAVLVIRFLNEKMKLNLSKAEIEDMQMMARNAVLYAGQVTEHIGDKDERNKAALEAAKKRLIEEAAAKGKKIATNRIIGFIEAEVKNIKLGGVASSIAGGLGRLIK
jgi:hypothetical protein